MRRAVWPVQLPCVAAGHLAGQLTDAWGGSVDERIKFVVDVARETAAAIGGDKLGIRLSPDGTNSGMVAHPDLVQRLKQGQALNAPDMGSFFTPGAKGYTDYALAAA